MKTVLYLTIVVLSINNSWAQLNVTSTSVDFTIDFNSTVNGVNEGPYDGTGLDPIIQVQVTWMEMHGK